MPSTSGHRVDRFHKSTCAATRVQVRRASADSADHKKEFEILRNELEQYNPDMLQKDFVIAISKSDMLDDELKEAIKKELPKKIPHVFISSFTNQGLTDLKDLLWETMNTAKV